MIEISIPTFINFTIDGEFTIANLSEKIRDLELEKLVLNHHEKLPKKISLMYTYHCKKLYYYI